ncbi:MAG: hypothetical protein FJ395_03870 [Verrucomicrobia bacterium]|nr:hypothetical protein [Verrucomicrobiota bacterium]
MKYLGLLAVLSLLGCASNNPISGRRPVQLAVEPNDNVFFITRNESDLRYGKYLMVERFPNPATVRPGMPSRAAFELLGKATGITLDLSSVPPAHVAMKTDKDIMVEWRTTASWSWARRHAPDRIETADVAVSFVKVTRTKAEVHYVGSPLFRTIDQGWFIEQINVLPVLHNLKTDAQRRPADAKAK